MNEPEMFRHRLLVIDDNPAIHEDYRKILVRDEQAAMSAAEAVLVGEDSSATERPTRYPIDSSIAAVMSTSPTSGVSSRCGETSSRTSRTSSGRR